MFRRPVLLLVAVVLLAGVQLPASTPAPAMRYATNMLPGLADGDSQGTSVAAYSDGPDFAVVVGAPGAAGAQAGSGVVRIYDAAGALTQTLQAADGQTGAKFGASVAISEDYLAVGAPDAAPGGVASGAVYVYRRSGATWNFLIKLTGTDAVVGDRFGTSVSLDVYRLVVGAPGHGGGQGAAYIFEPSGDAFVQTQAPLTMSTGRIFSGHSVAAGWGWILVGAPGSDSVTGAVDVYVHDGSSFVHETTLVGSDTETADRFGRAVSLFGGGAAVGAPLDDVDGVQNCGSVYIFQEDGSGNWSEHTHLRPPAPTGLGNFGASVAVADVGIVLVGEPFRSDGGQVHEYSYHDDGFYLVSSFRPIPGVDAAWQFGESLAATVNFWTDDRIIVGAPWTPMANESTPTSGAAFLLDPFPLVSAVLPAGGPTTGGTTVTVNGVAIDNWFDMRVFVDGVEQSIADVTETTLTFVTPPHAAGTVDVRILDEETGQDVTIPGAFTYTAPFSVANVIPHFGSPAGGTPVTIVGAGFQDGATIRFGASSATAVTFVDDTTLTGLTPAGAAGVVDVTVTNPDTNEATLAGGFQYTDTDLQVARFIAPTGVGVGEAFAVTDTTKNIRPGTTPPTTTAFFIQPTFPGSAAPDLMAPAIAIGQREVPSFAGRGANGATTSVMVPPGTPPGVYTLFGQADFDQEVGERNELNNLKSRRLVVGGDLQAMPLRAPMAAVIGTTITITARTKNAGPGTAPPGTTTRVLLSTDAVPDIGDLPVVEWTLGALAPWQIDTRTHQWEVPIGPTPGRHYLIVVVDQGGVWAELNEGNNTRAKPLTVR